MSNWARHQQIWKKSVPIYDINKQLRRQNHKLTCINLHPVSFLRADVEYIEKNGHDHRADCRTDRVQFRAKVAVPEIQC